MTDTAADGAMAAAKEWTDDTWPEIFDTIMSAVTAIREGIDTFITEAWAKWGDEIMAVVNVVWPHIQTMISSVDGQRLAQIAWDDLDDDMARLDDHFDQPSDRTTT